MSLYPRSSAYHIKGGGELRTAPIRRVQYAACVGCAWGGAGQRTAPSSARYALSPHPHFPADAASPHGGGHRCVQKYHVAV